KTNLMKKLSKILFAVIILSGNVAVAQTASLVSTIVKDCSAFLTRPDLPTSASARKINIEWSAIEDDTLISHALNGVLSGSCDIKNIAAENLNGDFTKQGTMLRSAPVSTSDKFKVVLNHTTRIILLSA